MSEKAKWVTGRYNTHQLELAYGVSATISWAVTGEPGYVVRFLGGGSRKNIADFDKAKKFAEDSLRQILTTALERLP